MSDDVSDITCELTPKMSVILKMFDPIIFPRAMLVFFFTAATTDAANSGSDVPHAISVNEMKASLTPNDFAISTALSINMSQLVISKARPPTTFMVEIHKGLVFSFSSLVGVKFFLSRAKEYHIKTAKHTRRIMPSILLSEVSAPLKKLNERIVSRIDTPIHKGSSNFRFLRSTAMGKNSAVSPKMPNTLKMLDPTPYIAS